MEKVSNGISSPIARSCNSKRSAGGVVKVMNISNPTTLLKASASEFRVFVQPLTGQKGFSPSSSQHEQINLCSDNEYNPRGKALKLLNDELQCLNDVKPQESAIIAYKAAMGVSCNDRDQEYVSIFEELGVLPIVNPSCVVSQKVF